MVCVSFLTKYRRARFHTVSDLTQRRRVFFWRAADVRGRSSSRYVARLDATSTAHSQIQYGTPSLVTARFLPSRSMCDLSMTYARGTRRSFNVVCWKQSLAARVRRAGDGETTRCPTFFVCFGQVAWCVCASPMSVVRGRRSISALIAKSARETKESVCVFSEWDPRMVPPFPFLA